MNSQKILPILTSYHTYPCMHTTHTETWLLEQWPSILTDPNTYIIAEVPPTPDVSSKTPSSVGVSAQMQTTTEHLLKPLLVKTRRCHSCTVTAFERKLGAVFGEALLTYLGEGKFRFNRQGAMALRRDFEYLRDWIAAYGFSEKVEGRRADNLFERISLITQVLLRPEIYRVPERPPKVTRVNNKFCSHVVHGLTA